MSDDEEHREHREHRELLVRLRQAAVEEELPDETERAILQAHRVAAWMSLACPLHPSRSPGSS